jgi:hypothetical protein
LEEDEVVMGIHIDLFGNALLAVVVSTVVVSTVVVSTVVVLSVMIVSVSPLAGRTATLEWRSGMSVVGIA